MQVALVAREFYPFIGGGIAPIVAAAARQLSASAEVTVVTSASYEQEYERLRAERDPLLPPESVRLVFVDEPDGEDWGAFLSYMHAYSARVDRALRRAFPDRGPDILEFCDYLGEGFVTAQALDSTRSVARADPTLREAPHHGVPVLGARRTPPGRLRDQGGLRRRALRPEPRGHGALVRRRRARDLRAGLRPRGARARR